MKPQRAHYVGPQGAPKGPVAITLGSQSIMHLTRLEWTSKREFCSLQAQRSITRPATPIDQIWLQTPFFESQILVFRLIFGRIGQNSAPGAPNDLSTGLSIVISPPRSVSEHQRARKCSKSGQKVNIQKIEK